MKAKAQQTSNFERTIFEEGTYEMTLDKAFVMWGKPTQHHPEGQAKIGMIWKFEADGETYELGDFQSFPKNFAYNDKSKFWKRLAEIAGVKITSDNAEIVDIDLGEFIQSYEELIEHIQTKNDQGRNERADVVGLTVGDQQMLGRRCQLVVKKWQNGDNEGNEIAAVLQIGGGAGPRVPQKKAAQPAAAAPAPQATKPPARPATPAPRQPAAPAPTAENVDLPF